MQIPKIQSPGIFQLPDIPMTVLSNGLQVYHIQDNTVNGIKVEISFPAGRVAEAKHSVSELCCELLKETAAGHSGYENATFFDNRGSSLYTYNGLDYCGIGFFALSEFAKELFDRWKAIISAPGFNGDELEKVKKRKLEKLNELLAENDAISYRSLTMRVFGKNHPYGYNSSVKTLRSVEISDISTHYSSNFFRSGAFVILVGNFDPLVLNYMMSTLDAVKMAPGDISALKIKKINIGYEKLIAGAHKQQCSVKIGLQLPNRRNSDFAYLYFMHILIGGYFHSRLNKNIRERRGLTYSIASVLETAAQAGVFYITADTDSKQKEQLLEQVTKELIRVREQEVGQVEMKMVRNYIIGNMIQLYDEVFAQAETLRQYLIEGCEWDLGYDLMRQISEMKAGVLNDKIREYLKLEKMITIIAE